MKRLLIILALLIALPCEARMSVGIVGSGGVAAAADPCGCPTSTYMFCYTGDHASGTGYACFTNGTATKNGTVVDATISTDYVSYSAVNDYIEWAVSSDDGVNDELGTLYFSAYLTDEGDATLEGGAIIEIFSGTDANNKILLYSYAANTGARGFHVGTATSHNVIGTGSLTTGAWFRYGLSWNVATSKLSVSIVALGSAHSWVEEADALVAFDGAAQPTVIRIGESTSGLSVRDIPVLIKNVIILGTYQAADPF